MDSDDPVCEDVKASEPRSRLVGNWLNENIVHQLGDDDEDEAKAECRWKELNAESIPSDFYVHVQVNDSSLRGHRFIHVTICPVVYFEKHKHLLDVTPDIPHLLPAYFRGEVEEAVLSAGRESADRNVESVTRDLTDRGFVLNEAFSRHCLFAF